MLLLIITLLIIVILKIPFQKSRSYRVEREAATHVLGWKLDDVDKDDKKAGDLQVCIVVVIADADHLTKF